MKPILRSILAIIAGFIIAPVIVILLQGINARNHPMPEGLTMEDRLAFQQWIDGLPLGAFLMVLVSWESGALIGGALCAWIAGRAQLLHAAIVGGWILLFTIMTLFMFKHPAWMIAAGVALPIPIAILGGKIVAVQTSPAKVEPG